MSTVTIKLLPCNEQEHAAPLLEILNEAIVNSTAIYDYHPRALDSMISWFAQKRARRFPVIGAMDPNRVLVGFSTYGNFRAWPAYKYSVEHSVYVHKDHRGKGIGGLLLRELIGIAQSQDMHIMLGGIDATNQASIALHERQGFVHAGTIRHAGFKFGRWLDLTFYQLILRTPSAPVDD